MGKLERLASQIEEKLGGNWRVELEDGLDADGDPGVWAWIALREDAPDDAWAFENRRRIEEEIRTAAVEAGIPDWIFVRFRKDAKERVAS